MYTLQFKLTFTLEWMRCIILHYSQDTYTYIYTEATLYQNVTQAITDLHKLIKKEQLIKQYRIKS